MKVYKIEPSGFASNTFAVTDDGKTCILIDCAQPDIIKNCKRLGLKPKAVLLTHGHFDHVCGCRAVQKEGVKIYCSEQEEPLIFSPQYLHMFDGIAVPNFEVDGYVREGDFSVGGFKIKVIATPGHSAGSVSYLIGNCLFTGDTLFSGSVGRADLPTGNYAQLVKSVKKLYALDGDYAVYSGHGENTTLNSERRYNTFVRQE